MRMTLSWIKRSGLIGFVLSCFFYSSRNPFSIFLPLEASASPCCSAQSAVPSLISGDEQARLSAGISYARVIGDAPSEGIPVFRAHNDAEVTQVTQIEGTFLLADRWQFGGNVPFLYRDLDRPSMHKNDWGIGDVRLSLGYEVLPEWSYSVWKPKGYLFTQLTLPTGRSVHQVTPEQPVVFGKGYYSVNTGIFLVKRWNYWDAFFAPQVRYSFSRKFEEQNVEIYPGFAGAAIVGGGVSPSFVPSFRLGAWIQSLYQQPQRSKSSVGESVSHSQLVWDVGVDTSYAFDDHWSLHLNYTDQTLLGPAINTTLSRTVAFSLQRNWLR